MGRTAASGVGEFNFSAKVKCLAILPATIGLTAFGVVYCGRSIFLIDPLKAAIFSTAAAVVNSLITLQKLKGELFFKNESMKDLLTHSANLLVPVVAWKTGFDTPLHILAYTGITQISASLLFAFVPKKLFS